MSILTTTVTQSELRTLERLNTLLREKEERERLVPMKYQSRHEPQDRSILCCDACQRRLGSRCWNVVVGMMGAVLTINRPMAEQEEHVTLRYHDKCYPEKLVEYLNAGYGHRRGKDDEKECE